MNTTDRRLAHTILASCLAVAMVFATAATQAKTVESSTPCAAVARGIDARLTAKADQGIPAFRGFVICNRAIYQMDMNEAVDRVERYRHTAATCGK